MQYLLEQHFQEHEICPAQNEPDFAKLPQQGLLDYRLFAGHFWGLPRRVQQPVRTMTWLREPLPRAVSMYMHIRRNPRHRLHEAAISAGGFERILYSPALKNSQVRHLSRLHREHRPDLTDEDCLLLAQEVIDDCFFVGFTERYEHSIDLLFKTLGWDRQGEIPKMNTASQRSPGMTIDPEESRRLDEVNALDHMLYRYACDAQQEAL